MKKSNHVYSILKKLEENNIPYVILRDYIPLTNIEKSMDVDIYIPLKYRSKVSKVFIDSAWYKPKINTSRYPHEQYIYLSDICLHKVDIVFGLYYGNLLYKLDDENFLQNIRGINGLNIPTSIAALITMILHIIFDKNYLSDKNKLIFSNMYEDYLQDSNKSIFCKYDDVFLEIAEAIYTQSIDECNKNINKYRKIILSEKILEFSLSRYIYYRIFTKIKNIFKNIIRRMSNNTICIVGVDGAGKSTLVNELGELLQQHTKIQYMGFKDYELSFVREHFINKRNNVFSKIKSYIYIYIEMWYRYLKNRFSHSTVLYDRYVDEAYINSKGIKKFLYTIMYKFLFPRPRKIFYLYCSTDTSFKRKDDILDKKAFIEMKNKFDKRFLNDKNIIHLSSDQLSSLEIVHEVTRELNNDFLRYFI